VAALLPALRHRAEGPRGIQGEVEMHGMLINLTVTMNALVMWYFTMRSIFVAALAAVWSALTQGDAAC
jgi:hypothetical protein